MKANFQQNSRIFLEHFSITFPYNNIEDIFDRNKLSNWKVLYLEGVDDLSRKQDYLPIIKYLDIIRTKQVSSLAKDEMFRFCRMTSVLKDDIKGKLNTLWNEMCISLFGVDGYRIRNFIVHGDVSFFFRFHCVFNQGTAG
jgi:hypothetical protein